ncbi:MAG: hypothetical protein AB4426_29790 [Xenococcaceae cyanobacterium]
MLLYSTLRELYSTSSRRSLLSASDRYYQHLGYFSHVLFDLGFFSWGHTCSWDWVQSLSLV